MDKHCLGGIMGPLLAPVGAIHQYGRNSYVYVYMYVWGGGTR
jgi:hypothetical protein